MTPAEQGSAGAAVRRVALRVLAAVERGGRSDRLLDQELRGAPLDERDRRLTTEIVYGTLRRLQSLDRTLAPFSKRPWAGLDDQVRNALRMGAYQVAFLRSVPAHAAVHATVGALPAKQRGARGMVNAVLRAWLRSGGQLCRGNGEIAARCEAPEWLAQRWVERYGAAATQGWFEAALEPPLSVLRMHPRRQAADKTLGALAAAGIQVRPSPWVSGAVRVDSGPPVAPQAFRQGTLSARSEAAQLVVGLLPRLGDGLVLDACAGRGGKSVQLAEESGARRVVAIDVNPGSLRDCALTARRTRAPEVVCVAGDLAHATPLRGRFDRILVDVPCSGLGTIRRHPEIKWRITPRQLEQRAAQQRLILGSCLGALAPGGYLLYVTCSTEPEENEQVVAAALEGRIQYHQEPVKAASPVDRMIGADGALRTFPAEPELDGFYAALVRRQGGRRGSQA